ncbi:dihydrofolate reductase family protein [Pseudoroseomonas globiformis]|uniref:Dihydrofolate reductase family protein n=1 Tax=Teichococcus globiformis TaxID=2307229 RepID=A0ABV7G764_9PROT
MGRVTYDQIPSFGVGWPYQGKQGIVVTSQPIPGKYPDVQGWHDGILSLARHLRTEAVGDAWIVGGAKLQAAFVEAGELDHLDLFIVPILLGDGLPLFPRQERSRDLILRTSRTLDKGMVRLSYDIG